MNFEIPRIHFLLSDVFVDLAVLVAQPPQHSTDMVTFSIKLFCLQTSTYVSSHFPEYWNKPEEYNPYRFEDEELLKRCVQTADILLQSFKALILTGLSALNSELTQIEAIFVWGR